MAAILRVIIRNERDPLYNSARDEYRRSTRGLWRSCPPRLFVHRVAPHRVVLIYSAVMRTC
jgi:hypothetical protein